MKINKGVNSDLNKMILSDRLIIPDFVDTKDGSHYEAFLKYQSINEKLIKITVRKILSLNVIIEVSNSIDDIFYEILAVQKLPVDLTDFSLTLKFYGYMTGLFREYIQICEDFEEYEIANNIHVLLSVIENPKNIEKK